MTEHGVCSYLYYVVTSFEDENPARVDHERARAGDNHNGRTWSITMYLT